MRLRDSQPLAITDSQSKLSFTTTGGGNWPVWDRFISLDEEQLFHIGNVCGTCEFFFRRMTDEVVKSFEIQEIRSQLATGLDRTNPIAESFRTVIPNGEYVVALLEGSACRAGEKNTPDYFAHEQRLAWYGAWEGNSGTSYYRTGPHKIDDQQLLFEFIIPLYDHSLLNPERVQFYIERLNSGTMPTAVALSVLDVKSSMSTLEDHDGKEIDPEFPTHWCFANYLLDGHHKVAASHLANKPVTLLTFISRDHSWKLIDAMMSEYEKSSI